MLVVLLAGFAGRPVERYTVAFPQLGSSKQSMNGGAFNTPFVGNGDVAAALNVDTFRAADNGPPFLPVGSQSLMFGKSDLWISDSTRYFSHMSAVKLSFDSPYAAPGLYKASGEQDLGNARVSSRMQGNSSALNASTVIGENNVVLTTLTCDSNSSAPCPIDVTLADTSGNAYKLETSAGYDTKTPTVWWRKANVHTEVNAAYVGSCDPETYILSVERAFLVDPTTSAFSFRNGSCLWLDDPSNATNSIISTGACGEPQGKWTWKANSSLLSGGADIVYSGGGAGKLCLGQGDRDAVSVSDKFCGLGLWTFNVSFANVTAGAGYVGIKNAGKAPSCLIVIPDNTNNTLGVALTLIDAATNAPPASLKMKTFAPPASYPSGLVNVSVGFTATLEVGKTYLMLTSLVTLRDMGCAGTRAESSRCAKDPAVAAVDLVQSIATSNRNRVRTLEARNAWWAAYWNASAIDITSMNTTNTNLTSVERFYYLQQYCLAATVRPGKIAPALIGNLVHTDPSAWNDQLTLDYNFEANFWGAGSSNHPEMYLPYIDVVANPGLLATMRGRATNPGVWKPAGASDELNGGWQWTVPVGHTASNAIAVPAMGKPDISDSKGFKGAAWTSTAFPLGDGRPDPSDYSTRFVGGLVATDLIQYYEYTQDRAVLESTVYPIVRDNAEFYISYVRPVDTSGASGEVYFPWSCGQEMCVCRNGGPGYGGYKDVHILPQRNMTKNCQDTMAANKTAQGLWNCPGAFGDTGMAGEHNAHADIAFASQSFKKAIEYSLILNVDADLRAVWTATLAKLPRYPSVVLNFLPGSIGEEVNGQTLLTEGLTGPTATPLPWYNSSAPYFSGPVWPWCNSEYPITNYAAMWPTEEIGTLQTGKSDPQLLKAAHDTVWAINQYTGWDFAGSHLPWANTNGFCLSWPPAVRVSGGEGSADPLDLINKFSRAINARMNTNGIVNFRGGMLENMGATVAINDMLMQSHAGEAGTMGKPVVRLFPVWNAKDLGPASFTTLRAYGAFLVSARVESAAANASLTNNVQSPITVTAEVGGTFRFLNDFWGSGIMCRTAGGATVPISGSAPGVMSIDTKPGTTYLFTHK
eukprot:Hpha_TRINITY_DN12336_c0_g1::TRINITY_DN12336_c0_g1_i1::g.156056::m.156056